MDEPEATPDYYRRREAQQREAASAARDEDIKAIHLALADRYAGLAEQAERGSDRPNSGS